MLNKLKTFHLISICATCFVVLSNAGYANYNFIEVKDGFNPFNDAIRTIEQDSYGFMWFGGEKGLYRFDGYKFKKYSRVLDDNNSLAGSSVYKILADSHGQIWVATNNGLSRYSHELDHFTNFYLEEGNSNGLISNMLYDLKEDWDGNIWIATDKGVNIFDSAEIKIKKFLPQPENANSQANHINHITIDLVNKTVYLASNSGLHKLNKERSSNSYLETEVILAITPSADRELYIFTERGEVKETHKGKIIDSPITSSPIFSVHSALAIEGKLWIGENNNRFSVCTLIHNKCNKFSSINDRTDYGGVRDIFLDKDNNIWLATTKGVFILTPNARVISDIAIQNKETGLQVSPTSIKAINTNELLVTTTKGVVKHNLKHSNSQFFSLPIKNPSTTASLKIDGSNYLIGAFDGIFNLSIDTGESKLLSKLPGLKFHKLNNEEILVATRNNKLIRLNLKTKEVSNIFMPQIVGSISNNDFKVISFYQNKEDTIWMGTWNHGLTKLELDSWQLSNYQSSRLNNSISNNTVKGIYQDRTGDIWLTTWHGLNRFNPKTNEFVHFTERDGFPSNLTLGLLVDKNEQLWISTDRAFVKFDTKSHKLDIFNSSDGLNRNARFSMGAYHQSPYTEKMYFGGRNTLIEFDPYKLSKNKRLPNTLITRINFVGIDAFSEGYLKAQPYMLNSMSIPSSVNEFGFEFSTITHVASDRNQYRYKLEGYSKGWVYTDSNRRFVSFSNLWPGQYNFVVQGSNKDGVWDEQGDRISVYVLPPWYLTWWAYILYIIFVATFVFNLIRWRVYRFKIKAEKLERQVVERTKTINQLMEQKDRLFAQFSHEFRTPLTLIQYAIEFGQARTKNSEALNKFSMAKRNSSRLVRMVEQLLILAKYGKDNLNKDSQPSTCVDVKRTIDLLIESYQQHIDSHKVKVNTDIDKSIFLAMPQEAFEKIISNLISNAIKYSKPLGLINIRAYCIESSNFIEVLDEGEGIKPDEQAKIFDHFYRSESVIREGSGIGLSLVKELVENYQGSVSVKSTFGEGSLFTVRFPKPANSCQLSNERIQIGALHELDKTTTSKVTPSNKASKNNLLIVEDNLDMQQYLVDILKEDYNCILAENGVIGGEIAVEHIPDIIISDIMMPNKDGIEMLEELKENPLTCHIPIILLTAKGDLATKLSSLKLSANDYLTKPFESEELILRIKNLLTSRDVLRTFFEKQMKVLSHGNFLNISSIEITDKELKFREKVRLTVEENYINEDFNMGELAKLLFVTDRQLQRKLKAVFNCSPTEYIRNHRLNCAASLIKQEMPLSEVAFNVGFKDYAYFSKCFKLLFEVSPKEYRDS